MMSTGMNFYQRANLNVNLALTIALINASLALASGAPPDSFLLKIYIEHWLWMGFQFIFCIKVVIDDHQHFSDSNYDIAFPDKEKRFWDFSYFVIFGILTVASAAFSYDLQTSMPIFVGAMILASIWLLHTYGSYALVRWYFYTNIAYALIIIEFTKPLDMCLACHASVNLSNYLSHPAVFFPLLFAILVLDVMVSKTPQKMP